MMTLTSELSLGVIFWGLPEYGLVTLYSALIVLKTLCLCLGNSVIELLEYKGQELFDSFTVAYHCPSVSHRVGA